MSGHRPPALPSAGLAKRRGVVVLNDPDGLLKAMNKMYFQHFPEEVRPRTLISRNREDIKAFITEMGGNAVIKPLSGSGGTGVFMAKVDDRSNINQMIDTLIREGYLIAQEYLTGGGRGRHPLVHDERQVRCATKGSMRLSVACDWVMICAVIFMRAVKKPGPKSPTVIYALRRSSVLSWSRTACFWSDWISSATS